MVKHLVMWRLCAGQHTAGALQGEPAVNRAIEAMRTGIDGLRTVEIGFNKADASDASDLVLYTEFDSWEALRAYEQHPLHEEFRRIIGPIRTERRVVDYECS